VVVAHSASKYLIFQLVYLYSVGKKLGAEDRPINPINELDRNLWIVGRVCKGFRPLIDNFVFHCPSHLEWMGWCVPTRCIACC
jgi:hypothetical protein